MFRNSFLIQSLLVSFQTHIFSHSCSLSRPQRSAIFLPFHASGFLSIFPHLQNVLLYLSCICLDVITSKQPFLTCIAVCSFSYVFPLHNTFNKWTTCHSVQPCCLITSWWGKRPEDSFFVYRCLCCMKYTARYSTNVNKWMKSNYCAQKILCLNLEKAFKLKRWKRRRCIGHDLNDF